jgi:hypothetical protein
VEPTGEAPSAAAEGTWEARDASSRVSEEHPPTARRTRRRSHGRAVREDQGDSPAWSIRDLSATGAFLETKAPLEIGTQFDLSLILGTAVIQVMARVVRTQEASARSACGAGIEFMRLSDGAKTFLESYIEVSEGGPL